jgi:hypothetical protein
MQDQVQPLWISLTPSIVILIMILVNDQYLKRKIRRWRREDEREHAERMREIALK